MVDSTIGEIIKGILNVAVGNYTNYEHKPAVLLIGVDELDRMPPGQGILIKERYENPDFTVNGQKIFKKKYCEVRILEHSSSEREKLFADVESLLLDNSSYDIIYRNLSRDNIKNLFIVKFEVELLN